MKLILRTTATWAVECAVFFAFAHLFHGVDVVGFGSVAAVVVIVGALNAALRPALLHIALNLGLGWFALLALSLNVVLLYLADRIVPGVRIYGAGRLVRLALTLAAVNALFTWMLSVSDADSYYRNVTRRVAKRRASAAQRDEPGTVILQIDGLAEPILRAELAAGHMPNVRRLLDGGSHRLVRWDCGVPSLTPASQAGILHGNSMNVPAFRWYEKDLQRLVVADHPKDARFIDERQRTGHGLLQGGASNANIFGGEAEHLVMTQAGLVDEHGKLRINPGDFYAYLLNPYNIFRTVVGMAGEVVLEYLQAWQQRRRRGEPRVARGGILPFVRAGATVGLRNITEYLVIDDMYSGRTVSYSDFGGYDEVAHHAGPQTPDALGELCRIDRVIGAVLDAATQAPRPYRFVLLSDHGQSTGWTFKHLHGYTLAEFIDGLTAPNQPTTFAAGRGEGLAQISAALNEAASVGGRGGGARRRVLRAAAGPVHLSPAARLREQDLQGHTVVAASGNLALVYFADQPGRLTLETIERDYPGVIAVLRRHPSIGFLLVLSESRGPLVLGHSGCRRLDDDAVEGDDPLADAEPSTADSLRRLSTFTNVGDIVLNSRYDPRTGLVVSFEELVGVHGGVGGLQTHPFLLYPADWCADDPYIVGPEAMHAFLRQHIVTQGSGSS